MGSHKITVYLSNATDEDAEKFGQVLRQQCQSLASDGNFAIEGIKVRPVTEPIMQDFDPATGRSTRL